MSKSIYIETNDGRKIIILCTWKIIGWIDGIYYLQDNRYTDQVSSNGFKAICQVIFNPTFNVLVFSTQTNCNKYIDYKILFKILYFQ